MDIWHWVYSISVVGAGVFFTKQLFKNKPPVIDWSLFDRPKRNSSR